jgi:pimeloyl-ACP methyl ester carboxylesterase
MHRNPLTTADIPSEFWEDAYLVGKVPFKAASVDQRASYCMYVPKKHYKLEPSQKIPLIVSIHGNGRNAERCRDTMIDLADRERAAILAPLFPAGINDPNDMQNYKMLSYEEIRYDLVLLGIIDEIAVRWPGIATAKFFLTGYSGGGQFALRFFYLHPARLEAVSVGAPGLVTQLDDTLNWPKGIKGIESLFGGLSVDLSSLRNVGGVQLFVGSDDTKKPGGGFVEWLRGRKDTVKEIKELSGSIPNRNESMLKLQEGFKSAGIQSEFDIIDGMAHENGKAVPKIIEFLEPHLANWHSK